MFQIQEILQLLQLTLSLSNVCIIGYGFYKFLNKPHDSLADKVNTHDVEIKEIKASLLHGNDRFREQENVNETQSNTNAVIIHSVLALIEFEIQYCLTEHKDMSEGLKRAKEDLNNYLSRK